MAKRPMTNIEKVRHIMSYSSYGPIAQLFVMDALHKWSDIISKASPEQVGNGFVDGATWIGVAREIHRALRTDFSLHDSDAGDDDCPFGEIHFDTDDASLNGSQPPEA